MVTLTQSCNIVIPIVGERSRTSFVSVFAMLDRVFRSTYENNLRSNEQHTPSNTIHWIVNVFIRSTIVQP